jgi:hypothetical protein
MLVAQHQAKLQGIKGQTQPTLNRIEPHKLDADIDIDGNSFTFKAVEAGQADKQERVSIKIPINPTINVTVGKETLTAVAFFTIIGCYDPISKTINMMILNQIKQYLDMIKDGTSSKTSAPCVVSVIDEATEAPYMSLSVRMRYGMSVVRGRVMMPFCERASIIPTSENVLKVCDDMGGSLLDCWR